MNFESVRSIIDTYIKKNGVEAITGDILNNVLNTMLDDVDTAISSIEPSPGGGGGGTADLSDYYTKGQVDGLLGGYLPLSGGTIKNGSVRNPLSIDTTDPTGAYLVMKANGVNRAYFGYDSSLGALIQDISEGSTILYLRGGAGYIGIGAGWNTLIHSGNVGSYAPIYNASGNVLIGTTTDNSAKLQVNGNIDSFSDGEYSGVIGFNRKSAVGGLYNTAYAGWQIHNHLGTLVFFCEPASGSDGGRMVINESGNVGIGTTSPTSKLHIVHDNFPNILLESSSVESSIYFKSLHTGQGWAAGTGVWNQHFGIGIYDGGTSQWILSLRKDCGTDIRGGLQIYRQFYGSFDEGIRVVGAINEYCGIFLGTDSQYYGYTDHQWNLMKTNADTFAIARGLSTNVFFQIDNSGDTYIYHNLIVAGDVASA